VVLVPEEKIFPFLREKAPIVDIIREKTGRNNTKPVGSPSELAVAFRNGLSDGLGLPLEAVDLQKVQSWVVDFLKAFATPEMMSKVAPNTNEITLLGRNLGSLLKASFIPPAPSEGIVPPVDAGERGSKKSETQTRSGFDASVIQNG